MLDSTHQDDLQHPLQNNRKKVSVEQNGDRSFELRAFGHAHRHFENLAMHHAVSRIRALHCHRKRNKMAITSSVIVSIDAVGTVRWTDTRFPKDYFFDVKAAKMATVNVHVSAKEVAEFFSDQSEIFEKTYCGFEAARSGQV